MPFENLKARFPEEGNLCLKNCGKCCKNDAPVEKSEAEEINQWLCDHVEKEDLIAQFHHFDEHPNQCPFLKPDKSCMVYPVRPTVCRMFGHLPDLPGMPKKLSQECPEDVKFTMIPQQEWTGMEMILYMAKTQEASIKTVNFRTVEVFDEEGNHAVIPFKEGSQMEKMSKTTVCTKCEKKLDKQGYLQGAHILCQQCYDDLGKEQDAKP